MSNTDSSDPDDGSGVSRRGALIVGIVVIIAALVGALVLFTGDDDDSTTATTDTATTDVTTPATDATVPDTEAPTSEPSATVPAPTEPATTPATDPPDVDDTRNAVWPWAETSTRFADPTAAVTSFAVDYLGFVDPVVGDFQAGDARSGEIEIKAGPVGPTTVVFVRQLSDDDSWWVLGAAAETITVDAPTQGAVATSPLTISGTASAFEGTVGVELRADEQGEAIYEGFVTGSGGPELGPYEDTIEFTSPGATGGALVLISRSPEDGGPVVAASALRVFFE